MHNKLLIASHNKGKVEEFQRMLNLDGVELLSLEDQGITFSKIRNSPYKYPIQMCAHNR